MGSGPRPAARSLFGAPAFRDVVGEEHPSRMRPAELAGIPWPEETAGFGTTSGDSSLCSCKCNWRSEEAKRAPEPTMEGGRLGQSLSRTVLTADRGKARREEGQRRLAAGTQPLGHGIMTRQCPRPAAGRLVHLVAGHASGTAAGDHARRLIGKDVGGVGTLDLESDHFSHPVTVLRLEDLPDQPRHLAPPRRATLVGPTLTYPTPGSEC